MIYIKNNTEIQTIYINRNDEMPCGGHHAGSSDYMDGYEEGFGDGYESGTTDQINRLASTAFTYNSAFTRADGWSSVTVNVPQSGHTSEELQEWYDSGYTSGVTDGYESGFTDGYDSGFTDGYNSGYTDGYNSGYTSGTTDGFQSGYTSGLTDGYSSGWTDGYASGFTDGYNSGKTDGYQSGYTEGVEDGKDIQKSLLASTAFTENGHYEREDGWNEVNVNVENKKISDGQLVSISANGTTVITPPNYGIITLVQSNDKIKIAVSGYSSAAYIGYINDEVGDYGNITILWENGLNYNDSDWSGGTINASYTGNTIIEIEVENSNLQFIGDGDTGGTYDGMSLIQIDANVPTTGHTDQEMQDNWQDGYDSGFTDGFSSGYTDGEQSIIDTFTSTTINQNGVYGDSAHPFTSVTVNVPTSGGTSILGSGSFSANGTFSATSENLDGYNVITIDVPQDYTQDDLDEAYESGYTDCLDSLETVSFSANGIYSAETGEGWNKVIVNVPTSGSSAILGELNVSQNGVYIAENDGLTGYSAVTVNTSYYSSYGELYALYCVDASLGEWSYSDTWENRTADCYSLPFMVYPLSDVHIKISGKYRNSNVLRDLQIQYDPSGCPFTINYDGVEKTGRLRAVSSLDEFNSFSFYNRQANEAIFEYIDENGYVYVHFPHAAKMEKRAIGISGSCFYLLNYFDCYYHVGIDRNGRAYYAYQKNKYYPTTGRCYPVFRERVDGVYKYTIVNAFTAPTTP